MSNEKMAILKMLEEKKITAEEASRLLESVSSPNPKASSAFPPPPRPKEVYTSRTDDRSRSNNQYGTPPREGRGGESLMEELGRKFGTLMRDVEPKLHKFTEVVVEKTAGAADSISKSISSAAASAPPPAPKPVKTGYASRPSAPPVHRNGTEKLFEKKITGSNAELSISGLNGQVLIKGYNGDKISARIFSVPKRPGASGNIEIMVLGNKYYLSYDENDFERVCIDAFVPELLFANMKIQTINGSLNISNITTRNIKIENIDGDTQVNQLSAENIILETNNGQLGLSEINAANASFESFNGAISASSLDIERMKLATFNGGLNMTVNGFNKYTDYFWTMECSNDKLNLLLPSTPDAAYYVKANAALSYAKIGLTGLSYIHNDKSFAEAKSFNYETSPKKVNLNLETSNAPIIIN